MGKLQPVPLTDPMVEEKSEKPMEPTHKGLQVNQKVPEGPEESGVLFLTNQSSAGGGGGGGGAKTHPG